MKDEVTVVLASDFSKDPSRYLANVDQNPIRIVEPSGLTITVMGLADPRPRTVSRSD